MSDSADVCWLVRRDIAQEGLPPESATTSAHFVCGTEPGLY